MNPRRKQRLITVGVIGGMVISAVSLMLFALNDNIDLFYTPTEIVQGKDETGVKPLVGQRLRIGGLVVEGSVKRNQDTLAVEFDLMDIGPTVTVSYTGILPDLFREGQGIVATGVLQANNMIVAEEVLAKHDEEYMPPELAEQLKGIQHVKPSEAGLNPAPSY
ncbi:cytochrome c maturation protein CcmE [Glaciecola sp. HTCC2999]|uniref:cytochrome c maturation protein CcmE n=1 Tax=Glaciecola sp. HTCC2999 TaxID=455436 RepID=UPI0000E0E636|nr:cytochrome c maturation protein CcmE [Glaciecola sp. HTCC2999]